MAAGQRVVLGDAQQERFGAERPGFHAVGLRSEGRSTTASSSAPSAV